MKSVFKNVFLLFFVMSLVACDDTPIIHDLQERDANEILVLLSQHSIEAKKEKAEVNQEITWTVTVTPENEAKARSILVANNLPRIRHGGLSGICQDAGLIATPKTEKCREILAYKGEIINSLESIPGVVSADVVLNIPDKEEFPDKDAVPARPTASVTVQYLPNPKHSTKLTEQKVQGFVANAVSGLDSRDVTVIISLVDSVFPQAAPMSESSVASENSKSFDGTSSVDESLSEEEMVSIGGLRMDEGSAGRFKLLGVLFLFLLLALTGALVYVLIRMAKLKRSSGEEEGLVPYEGDDDE
jgi:type III secretion protein J